MRRLLLLGLALALPAHADLYRWVDPQSGSVKYSSVPPDWYGDPLREGVSPRVEVLRYKGPASGPAAAKPAAEKPAAGALAGQAALEERWRSQLQFIAGMPQRADFDRSGAGLQQQMAAFQVVRTELDRLDPGGVPRRRAEETAAFERLKKALEGQK